MTRTWLVVEKKQIAGPNGCEPHHFVRVEPDGGFNGFAMEVTRPEFDAFAVGDEVTVTVERKGA